MEDGPESPPPRRQYQNFRSGNSNNWRQKDDNPPEQSTRYGGRDGGDEGQRSRGGYGQSRREPYGDRPPRELREIPGKPETPRLYVGNLLYTAQSPDISNFFNDNGFNVVNVSMSIDPMTGRNPSYCFVDLDSVEEATRAMETLNGAEVLGRQVRINPGVARKEGQSGPRRNFGSGAEGGGGERGGWRERAANSSSENVSYGRSSSERWAGNNSGQQSSRPPAQETSKRLYVGGLPSIEPQAVESEIQTLFSRAEPAIEIASVSNLIAPHASKAGEPGDHHYLFVDLKDETDADRAIEMFHEADSPWNEGGRLKVNRARENRDRGERRQGEGRGHGYGYGGAPRGRDGSNREFGRPSWRTENAE